VKDKNFKIKVTKNDGKKNSDGRPNVHINGEILNRTEFDLQSTEIKGKTLDLYYYLIQNSGFHGVREIQRALGYSSPGLTSYHLKRLIDCGAITKNELGHYGIEKDEVRLGSLDEHVKFINYWIPRTFLFATIFLLLFVYGILLLLFNLDPRSFIIIALPILILMSVTLYFDGLTRLTKLTQNNKPIDSRVENKLSHLKNQLNMAIILKNKPRARDKFEAQKIFQDIIEEEIINHELTIFAMFNMCDLLLDELTMYNGEEVLNDAQELSKRVYTIAKEKNSQTLIIEALLLQQRFELLNGNLKVALGFLEQAETLAYENNLESLVNKVSSEREMLDYELSRWRTLSKDNIGLLEKIDRLKFKEYINDALELINLSDLQS
jgi:hypothetical protein